MVQIEFFTNTQSWQVDCFFICANRWKYKCEIRNQEVYDDDQLIFNGKVNSDFAVEPILSAATKATFSAFLLVFLTEFHLRRRNLSKHNLSRGQEVSQSYPGVPPCLGWVSTPGTGLPPSPTATGVPPRRDLGYTLPGTRVPLPGRDLGPVTGVPPGKNRGPVVGSIMGWRWG